MAEFIPKYSLGYAINSTQLFTRFKLHYIKDLKYEMFKENSKKKVAAKIFLYFFYLVLKDIINNNTTFMFPTAFETCLEMGVVEGEDFKRARRNGAFQEIDFLASNFRGHTLQYRHKLKSGKYYKVPIHVHKKLKNIIIDNTNNGVKY